MVVITVGAYRSLNVLSHHFNLNSVFHDKDRVMVRVIMFTY